MSSGRIKFELARSTTTASSGKIERLVEKERGRVDETGDSSFLLETTCRSHIILSVGD